MRWPKLSLCILLCIIAANCEQTRQKRDLETILKIKKAIVSTIFGGQNPTYTNNPPETVKIYRIPGHEDVYIKAVPITVVPRIGVTPQIAVTPPIAVVPPVAVVPPIAVAPPIVPTNATYELLKHYLGTKTPEETFAALDRIEKLLQSGLLGDKTADRIGLESNYPVSLDPRFPEISEYENTASGEGLSYAISGVAGMFPDSKIGGSQTVEKSSVSPYIHDPLMTIPETGGYSYRQIHKDGSVTTYTSNGLASNPNLAEVPTLVERVPHIHNTVEYRGPPCQLNEDFPQEAFAFPPIKLEAGKVPNHPKPFLYPQIVGGYSYQQGNPDGSVTIYSDNPATNGITVDKIFDGQSEENKGVLQPVQMPSAAPVETLIPSIPIGNVVVPGYRPVDVHPFYHGIPHHHHYHHNDERPSYIPVGTYPTRPIFGAPLPETSGWPIFGLPAPLPIIHHGHESSHSSSITHVKPITSDEKPIETKDDILGTKKHPVIMHSLILNRNEDVANSIKGEPRVQEIPKASSSKKQHPVSGYVYKQLGSDGSVITYTDNKWTHTEYTPEKLDDTAKPESLPSMTDHSNEVIVENSVASVPVPPIPMYPGLHVPAYRPVDVIPIHQEIPHHNHMESPYFHHIMDGGTPAHIAAVPIIGVPHMMPDLPKPKIIFSNRHAHNSTVNVKPLVSNSTNKPSDISAGPYMNTEKDTKAVHGDHENQVNVENDGSTIQTANGNFKYVQIKNEDQRPTENEDSLAKNPIVVAPQIPESFSFTKTNSDGSTDNYETNNYGEIMITVESAAPPNRGDIP